MDMMRELAALLFAAVLAGPSVAAEFYVAPDGDEGNDGLAAKPVKILQRALDLTHKVEREEDEEIVRKDGFYPFEKPVVFRADDYGATGDKGVHHAYP